MLIAGPEPEAKSCSADCIDTWHAIGSLLIMPMISVLLHCLQSESLPRPYTAQVGSGVVVVVAVVLVVVGVVVVLLPPPHAQHMLLALKSSFHQ